MYGVRIPGPGETLTHGQTIDGGFNGTEAQARKDA